MVLYESSSQCYGCSACMQTCENNAISMIEDEEGFLYPVINEELCIGCGRCALSCQTNNSKKDIGRAERVMYAAYNNDWNIRRKSSSGGVFFSLARKILQTGGIVFGAAFNSDYEVEHMSADSELKLDKLIGSKYVQSNVKYTYREVKDYIKSGKEVLYAGTPCQISGLRNFLAKEDIDNLIFVSVICHGVCSPMVWRKYLNLKKGQYDEKQVTAVSFRDKKEGWHNFGLEIKLGDRCYRQSHKIDLYMKGFLQNKYLRPSCYECEAKKNMENADIILGDFWGIGNTYPELDDDKGVSCVLVNSLKGKKLWEIVKEEFVVREVSYEQIVKSNSALIDSPEKPSDRKDFFEQLNEEGLIEKSITNHVKNYTTEQRKLVQYPVLYQYLSRVIGGMEIGELIKAKGWKKISLYAMTDLMELVYQQLVDTNSDVSVKNICDKGYKRFQEPYEGVIEIIGIEKLKQVIENKEIDGVVLCNPMWEKEIETELQREGISEEKILTISELVMKR